MRAVAIVFIQVVIAVLVSGLVMPAVLFSVPQSREAGPLVLVILVVLLFGLLRLAWPQSKGSAPREGERREYAGRISRLGAGADASRPGSKAIEQSVRPAQSWLTVGGGDSTL